MAGRASFAICCLAAAAFAFAGCRGSETAGPGPGDVVPPEGGVAEEGEMEPVAEEIEERGEAAVEEAAETAEEAAEEAAEAVGEAGEDVAEETTEALEEAPEEAAETAEAAEETTEALEEAPEEAAETAEETAEEAGATEARSEALLDPSQADEKAPETYKVKMETTEGDLVIEVHREWSPEGADRFYNLVKIGYFDDVAFFRVLENFVAQFGIHGDPAVNAKWRDENIPDDVKPGEEPQQSNLRGHVTFAKSRLPNSRSTQLFINLSDNTSLDRRGFSPIGKVVEGMDVVDSLYAGYGEGAPSGKGPDQRMIQTRGNEYLKTYFPELDYIEEAELSE